MGETALELAAVEFLSFFFGIIGKLISTFVWWWVAYVLVRFLLQKVVFKNDSDGWKKFADNVRSGFCEFAVAFCNTMSGLASLAAQWAGEKKEERKQRKMSKVSDNEEPYW